MLLAVTGAMAAVLRLFPPAAHGFYPPCPFHSLFGILCPGCGATRALAALLDGRWTDAAHLNLFFVVLAPFLLALLAAELYSAFRWDRWRPIPQSPAAVSAVLTVAVLFGFARNMHWLFQGFQ